MKFVLLHSSTAHLLKESNHTTARLRNLSEWKCGLMGGHETRARALIDVCCGRELAPACFQMKLSKERDLFYATDQGYFNDFFNIS